MGGILGTVDFIFVKRCWGFTLIVFAVGALFFGLGWGVELAFYEFAYADIRFLQTDSAFTLAALSHLLKGFGIFVLGVEGVVLFFSLLITGSHLLESKSKMEILKNVEKTETHPKPVTNEQGPISSAPAHKEQRKSVKTLKGNF